MSVDHHTIGTDEEHYYYQSSDPHTAIPDWVPFCSQLSPEARNLITATLILQKRGQPPTRRELASALDVDERSIYRWLQEIGNAGAMSTRAAGRRRLNVFHKPTARAIPDRTITDRPITDRPITDRPITDHVVRYRGFGPCENQAVERHETAIPDQAISDPPVGVVGDDHDSENPTISTNRAPLKTPLARWLKQAGMNAARQFDDPQLDYDTYIRYVTDKRDRGWEWRQIVSTLREAPLEREAHMTPAASDLADGLADDLADDLAEISARREQLRQQMIEQVNTRPPSYHGGK